MRWLHSTAWLGASAVASIAIAFVSAALQRAGVAPVILSSLAVGAALGAAAIGSARFFGVYERRLLIVGAVAAALLLVVAQHFVLYFQHVRGWERAHQQQPELGLFRDATQQPLGEYLQQEAAGGRGWLWLLDGAIVTATAAGIAAGVRMDRREDNME